MTELTRILNAIEHGDSLAADQLLAGRSSGGRAWGVAVGGGGRELYVRPKPGRHRGAWAMARIARLANAPFLAAASSHIVGCASLAQSPDPDDWTLATTEGDSWTALRQLPEACYLGLVLPRFLLRLPYGKATDAVERFDFEEMPGVPTH